MAKRKVTRKDKGKKTTKKTTKKDAAKKAVDKKALQKARKSLGKAALLGVTGAATASGLTLAAVQAKADRDRAKKAREAKKTKALAQDAKDTKAFYKAEKAREDRRKAKRGKNKSKAEVKADMESSQRRAARAEEIKKRMAKDKNATPKKGQVTTYKKKVKPSAVIGAPPKVPKKKKSNTFDAKFRRVREREQTKKASRRGAPKPTLDKKLGKVLDKVKAAPKPTPKKNYPMVPVKKAASKATSKGLGKGARLLRKAGPLGAAAAGVGAIAYSLMKKKGKATAKKGAKTASKQAQKQTKVVAKAPPKKGVGELRKYDVSKRKAPTAKGIGALRQFDAPKGTAKPKMRKSPTLRKTKGRVRAVVPAAKTAKVSTTTMAQIAAKRTAMALKDGMTPSEMRAMRQRKQKLIALDRKDGGNRAKAFSAHLEKYSKKQRELWKRSKMGSARKARPSPSRYVTPPKVKRALAKAINR